LAPEEDLFSRTDAKSALRSRPGPAPVVNLGDWKKVPRNREENKMNYKEIMEKMDREVHEGKRVRCIVCDIPTLLEDAKGGKCPECV